MEAKDRGLFATKVANRIAQFSEDERNDLRQIVVTYIRNTLDNKTHNAADRCVVEFSTEHICKILGEVSPYGADFARTPIWLRELGVPNLVRGVHKNGDRYWTWTGAKSEGATPQVYPNVKNTVADSELHQKIAFCCCYFLKPYVGDPTKVRVKLSCAQVAKMLRDVSPHKDNVYSTPRWLKSFGFDWIVPGRGKYGERNWLWIGHEAPPDAVPLVLCDAGVIESPNSPSVTEIATVTGAGDGAENDGEYEYHPDAYPDANQADKDFDPRGGTEAAGE